MAPRRLSVSLRAGSAMEFTRLSVGGDKLVYVILLDKTLRYTYGKSHVAYIGTTTRGVDRVAQSAAAVAPSVLNLHGVRRFTVRLVTCTPRRNVRSWAKLERALLLAFRERYGEIPRLNTQGKRIRELDEFDLFSRARLRAILDDLDGTAPRTRSTRRTRAS